MKRWLSLFAVLSFVSAVLAFAPAPASAAGGINLSWADCGTFGTADRAFACATNSGVPNILVASFDAPANLTNFNGEEGVLDITDLAGAIPQWWNLQIGGCRSGSLTSSFDFTSGPFNCNDVFAGQASGGVNYDLTIPLTQGTVATAPANNHSRIKTVSAVADAFQQNITSGTEQYIFKLTINNAKSLVTCPGGCADKMCIVLNSIKLTQPAGTPGGDFIVSNGLNSATSNRVTFQGTGADCASVPVRNTTWGQVKSLYR